MTRHTVDGQPLILVLTLGQLHHLPQAPSTQCCLRILAKLVARSAAFAGYSGPELVLRPVVAASRPKVSDRVLTASHRRELGADPRTGWAERVPTWISQGCACGCGEGGAVQLDGSHCFGRARRVGIDSHSGQKGAHGENQEPGGSRRMLLNWRATKVSVGGVPEL